MLLGEYFTIENKQTEEDNVQFTIQLNPRHKVYQGHFPGMPVCPGVCNIQMIKECLQEEAGRKFTLDGISQCKFLSVITPSENKELLINMQIVNIDEEVYKIKATISNPDNTISFIDFKGEFRSR